MRLNKTTMLTASLLGVMTFAAAEAQTTPSQQQQQPQSQQMQPQPQSPEPSMQPMQSGQQSRPSFGQLDRNHDGQLSRSEIPRNMINLRAHFQQYDSDGNGSLSSKEYQAFVQSPTGRQ